MTDQHFRTMRIESGGPPGRFSMVLASQGEASDGDILNMRGGFIPSEMTLHPQHDSDPEKALGLVVEPRKDLTASPPVLHSVGQILMEGDGIEADIRRDIALKISRGIVRSVSIRWEPIKSTPRVDLPNEHEFFVDRNDASQGVKRLGSYHEEWRAMEGSVVGFGADKTALIEAGRGEGEIPAFWRGFVAQAEDERVGEAADSAELDKGLLREADYYSPDVLAQLVERLGSIDTAMRSLHDKVDAIEDLIDDQRTNDSPEADKQPERADPPEHQADTPARDADPPPTPQVPLSALADLFRDNREQTRSDTQAAVEHMTATLQGRVS